MSRPTPTYYETKKTVAKTYSTKERNQDRNEYSWEGSEQPGNGHLEPEGDIAGQRRGEAEGSPQARISGCALCRREGLRTERLLKLGANRRARS